MHALHQGIDRGDELAPGRTAQQRRIISHSGRRVGTHDAAVAKESIDQLELRERHGSPSMLAWAYGARGPIEHGVHELVAIGRTEAFGEAHRLVDDDAKGYFGAARELVRAD